MSEPLHAAQSIVVLGAGWLRLLLETIGGIFIAVGAITALAQLVRLLGKDPHPQFTKARLDFARMLAWALEFQLAADILDTAIEPEWQKIGQLAAIATIRTALNYFLSREMEEERSRLARERWRTGR